MVFVLSYIQALRLLELSCPQPNLRRRYNQQRPFQYLTGCVRSPDRPVNLHPVNTVQFENIFQSRSPQAIAYTAVAIAVRRKISRDIFVTELGNRANLLEWLWLTTAFQFP